MGIMLEAASDKVVLAFISSLLLIGAIGGNYAPAEEKVNVYDYKMGQIDEKMNAVMEDPTDTNIQSVYYDLMEEMQWSKRHISEQSTEYEAYLESCNDVLIDLSTKKQVVTTEINDENRVKVDSFPFLWVVGNPGIQM